MDKPLDLETLREANGYPPSIEARIAKLEQEFTRLRLDLDNATALLRAIFNGSKADVGNTQGT